MFKRIGKFFRGIKTRVKNIFIKQAFKIAGKKGLKQLIYIDKYGNKWYAFFDITMITMDRFLEIQSAERWYKLRINEENAKRFVDKMIQDYKESKGDDLYLRLLEFRARLEYKAERKSLLDYCSTIYLLNGESLDHYDRSIADKKRELLENNIDIQNFFLQDVIKRYIDSTWNSETAFLEYLDQVDLMNQLLEEKVRMNTVSQ